MWRHFGLVALKSRHMLVALALLCWVLGLASALPALPKETLYVRSAGLEIHTIALSGFPQAGPQADTDLGAAAASALPAGLRDHLLAASPPARSVTASEALVGFVKVAVATVTFSAPVWIHRDAAAPPDPTAAKQPYGFVPTPATSNLASNATGDLFGTLGLARLVCDGGRRVFESFPAPTESHAPPRFLVPAEHISLYLSELPAVTAALPGIMSCDTAADAAAAARATATAPGASVGLRGSSSGPGSAQLSFVLLMAHSRAGLPSLELLTDNDLSSCRLSFPPKSSQAWRPAGALSASLAPPAAAPSTVFTGSFPLPLVAAQARAHWLRAHPPSHGLRPLPGPRAMAASRAALSLCWQGPSAGFAGFRAPARDRLLPTDIAVRRALEASAEDMLSGRVAAPGAVGNRGVSARLSSSGRSTGAADTAEWAAFMQQEDALYDGQSRALANAADADGAGANDVHAATAPATAAATAAAGGRARAMLSRDATLDSLSSSLVVHAEPWVIALLETGSELSHDASLRSMGAAGNMMMGLLSGTFGPAIKPLGSGVGGSTGGDVGGALSEPIKDHVVSEIAQGIIDNLEPMLTGEISLALVPTLIETITDEVIEGGSLAIAEQVASDATPPLTKDITNRVTKPLVPWVVEHIASEVALDIVRNLTRPVAAVMPRALAHALVPALSMSLMLSPDVHEKCYNCNIKADPISCAQCPADRKNLGMEQWNIPASLYYAMYYTSYYSTYYGGYYSEVFANSPGVRMIRRRVLDPNDPIHDPVGFEGDGPGQI